MVKGEQKHNIKYESPVSANPYLKYKLVDIKRNFHKQNDIKLSAINLNLYLTGACFIEIYFALETKNICN